MNYRLIAVRLFAVALFWMIIWLWPSVAVARYDRSDLLEVSSFTFTVANDIAPSGSVLPGSTVTYTLWLTNTGDLPLANVRIAVLVPHYATAPAPGAIWQCAPVEGQPQKTICRTSVAMLAVDEVLSATFALELAANLPSTQRTLLLEANATADEVVCADCGYAWCETPIVQGGGEVEHRVLLPLITASNR